MKVTTIGIDIAKESFSICVMNQNGRVTKRKKVSRSKLITAVTDLMSPKAVIAMESCGGSQHWAREFRERKWDVRLIAAKFVKPYVKSQKNDAIDAEAICEACQRPRMRFVAIRSLQQQDIQCMVRVRARLVKNRTALCNEIRGFLLEYGVVVRRGVTTLRKQLLGVVEENEKKQSAMWAQTLKELYTELVEIDEKVAGYEKRLNQHVRSNEQSRRIATVPGVGTITASAIFAAVGDPGAYKNARQFAASMGLVPQQFSTGGRERLGRISRRGNKHLRALLVQGAQSVVNSALRKVIRNGVSDWAKTDSTSKWLRDLYARAGRNKTVVAMANKTARRVWAVMRKQEDFILVEKEPQPE